MHYSAIYKNPSCLKHRIGCKPGFLFVPEFINLLFSIFLFFAIFLDSCTPKPLDIKNKNVMKKDTKSSEVLLAPVAPRELREKKLNGITVKDYYFWMQNNDSRLAEYISEENNYAISSTKNTKKLSMVIQKEFEANDAFVEEKPLFFQDGYFYYSRYQKDKQYLLYCRKALTLGATEEIILDLNTISGDFPNPTIGKFEVSPDGEFIAFMISARGSTYYTLFVKKIEPSSKPELIVSNMFSFSWFRDSSTIFYTVTNKRANPCALFVHNLKSNENRKVFEEKDENYYILIKQSTDEKYLFISSDNYVSTEVYFIAVDDLSYTPKIIAKRIPQHKYFVDHHDGYFYIRTNDENPNFRIARVQVSSPAKKNWENYIPSSKSTIRGIYTFRTHFVILNDYLGSSVLGVGSYSDATYKSIALKEKLCSVSLFQRYDYNSKEFHFVYNSYTSLPTIYGYRFGSKSLKVFDSSGAQLPYAGLYASTQLFAPAMDGESIPISLIYNKKVKLHQPTPLYLKVYGSYGASFRPSFKISRLPKLNRGVIVAFAHVRGGGGKGMKWHEDGKLLNKMNSVNDFISVAKYLIRENYTSSDKLAASGMSAGGLVVAAAINEEPQLFKVVHLDVPVVDLVDIMLEKDRPGTISHYDEWGNPNLRDQLKYMLSYCPYHNVNIKRYPSIIITGRKNDHIIPQWSIAKYVAKLRYNKQDSNPLILRIYDNSGHLGSSSISNKFKDAAFSASFILTQLGITE